MPNLCLNDRRSSRYKYMTIAHPYNSGREAKSLGFQQGFSSGRGAEIREKKCCPEHAVSVPGARARSVAGFREFSQAKRPRRAGVKSFDPKPGRRTLRAIDGLSV